MPSARLEYGDVGVGVDADVGGDLETALDDLARGQLGILDQRARGGKRVVSAGADGENPVVRLDDVARSGDDEAVLAVGDRQQRLESAQDAIAPPILGELDRRALEVSRVALELFLELLEQRE